MRTKRTQKSLIPRGRRKAVQGWKRRLSVWVYPIVTGRVTRGTEQVPDRLVDAHTKLASRSGCTAQDVAVLNSPPGLRPNARVGARDAPIHVAVAQVDLALGDAL